jgi:hypothetical protein
MTVYVDDMRMKATVGNITARWSHLIADTPEELHEFAQKIGLRRAWFQEGKGNPGSYAAESWHYDVTDGIRARAIQHGAKAVSWDTVPKIIMRRMEGV